MSTVTASHLMRITVDIDDSILHEVEDVREKEGRSMDAIISELLADAIAHRKASSPARPVFLWTSRPMKALVDLADQDAVSAGLKTDRS